MQTLLLEERKTPAYLRYVDDLYILGNDLDCLWELNQASTQYLAGLRLRPHPDKVQIYRTSEAVDVLRYRVSRERRWLRNDNGYRFRRLMALYRAGRLE